MPSGIFTLKQQEDALNQYAWTNQKTPTVNYLVVAGGGSGGYLGGGGGGGGVTTGNVPIAIGSAITVTVGAGGVGQSVSGSNSVFGSIAAVGGGSGGSYDNNPGGNGGSGGGGGTTGAGAPAAGQGTANQGNRGGISGVANGTNYNGSGGGGGGCRGIDGVTGYAAGNGGAGVSSNLSGTVTVYAGGGGGGSDSGGNGGIGGVGGGGAGGVSRGSTSGSGTVNGVAGTANTGGGGGAFGVGGSAGNGGSGIVIISYPDTYAAAASTTGSPTVGTSGSGSISFSGSGQYLTYDGQSGFALGAGDFTIEFFVYLNSASGIQTIFDGRPTSTQGVYPTIYADGTSINFFVSSADRITGTSALSLSTWYHIALSRIGTSTKMFVNGSQVGSTYTDSNNYLIGTSRPAIASTGFALNSLLMNGYISNFRIVKGTGLYSSNFTAPAAPLTTVAGTSFLLNTASGAYAADSSGNGYAPVATGTPAWNSLSPFATGLGYKNRVYTWTSSGSITF